MQVFWNYPSKQKSWPIDEEMESLGEVIHPLDNIGGFDVRPGFYQMNGAYQTEEGVKFYRKLPWSYELCPAVIPAGGTGTVCKNPHSGKL